MNKTGLFDGKEGNYARFRPGIPEKVVDTVIELSAPNVSDGDLMDLGTGTGQVAVAMADRFRRIYAVELEASMLQRAREDWAAINPKPRAEAFFVEAEALEFVPPEDADIRLVTICRAFHWMSPQDRYLDHLAQVLPGPVSVAVFGDSSLWNSEAPWAREVKATIQKYLGKQRRAGSGTFNHHDRPYSEILSESEFALVNQVDVPCKRAWTSEQVLGYLFSSTFASKELFGDRVGEFVDDIQELLAPFEDDGVLWEEASFRVVVGSRLVVERDLPNLGGLSR